jgi:hypothetical protein
VAISSAVIGRYGDMVGVWIAPVTAQVMMTLRGDRAWVESLMGSCLADGVDSGRIPESEPEDLATQFDIVGQLLT